MLVSSATINIRYYTRATRKNNANMDNFYYPTYVVEIAHAGNSSSLAKDYIK